MKRAAKKYTDALMAIILKLRREGWNYDKIAVKLDLSPSTVQKWIYAGMGGATLEDRQRRKAT